MSALSVAVLKELLKRNHVKSSGNKRDLVERAVDGKVALIQGY